MLKPNLKNRLDILIVLCLFMFEITKKNSTILTFMNIIEHELY